MAQFPFTFLSAMNLKRAVHRSSPASRLKKSSILGRIAGGCLVVAGGGAFVLFATTPAVSLLYSASELLSLDEKLRNYCQGKLFKNLGWQVDIKGSIRAAWMEGRLVFDDLIVQYGAVDASDAEIPQDVPPSQNYTRFRVELDRLELKLSLWRFLAGRGLIEAAEVDGGRGVVDKRFVRWIDGWRWRSRSGDLDMKELRVRNVHLQVMQPRGYHPYSVTILQAVLPRLRLAWLFYDVLHATEAQGIFDGHALFSLNSSSSQAQPGPTRHFQLLGMDVKHLAAGADAGSPLNWLTRGFVDIEAVLTLPVDNGDGDGDDVDLQQVLERVLLEKAAIQQQAQSRRLPSTAAIDTATANVNVNVHFTFRSLRTRQPTPTEVERLLGGSSSRLKQALLVPVLGYVNEHRPEIPLNCRVQLSRGDFLGAWSGWECGLFGGVARGLDEAFRALVWDPENRMRRLSRVGKYALQTFLLNKPFLPDER